MILEWIAAIVVLAQAPTDEPSFKVASPLVLVPATVKDFQGRTIEGLKESDFVLLDNGVAQRPSLEFTLAPVSLVLVIETSSRSGAVLRKVQKIGSLLQPLVLGEHGAAAVVTFAGRIRIWQDFTSRPEILGECLRNLEPQGAGARMHDAVAKAVDMLAERRDRGRRKVIVVVSESKDRSSETKLADLVTRAQAANIVIYPLSYSAQRAASSPVDEAGARTGGYQAILTELAARSSKDNSHAGLAKYTGGEELQFTKLDGLERVIQRVAEDLHSQYLLSFTPSGGGRAVEFHKLEVQVKGHPEAVVVRARPAYWTSDGGR